jgi:hypothetical protein
MHLVWTGGMDYKNAWNGLWRIEWGGIAQNSLVPFCWGRIGWKQADAKILKMSFYTPGSCTNDQIAAQKSLEVYNRESSRPPIHSTSTMVMFSHSKVAARSIVVGFSFPNVASPHQPLMTPRTKISTATHWLSDSAWTGCTDLSTKIANLGQYCRNQLSLIPYFLILILFRSLVLCFWCGIRFPTSKSKSIWDNPIDLTHACSSSLSCINNKWVCKQILKIMYKQKPHVDDYPSYCQLFLFKWAYKQILKISIGANLD